ncbi:unnamed protein product [Anisakis simplex]|uniref:Glycogen-binding subunit 76A (inferred by orthology to a D. melanogaster protein) n=2 Tax=Anisakis simplex TaxID=6269 RepID=A0A0M3KBY9_ANISI|nr:unnamed protein product [Anisakis simplex]
MLIPHPVKCERSVSLSSALKKSNSHGDKKAVHFADSLGLDLCHVRPFVSFGDPDDEIFGTTPPLYFKGFHQASYVTPLAPAPPRKIGTIGVPTFTTVPTYLHTHFTPVGGYAWQNNFDPNERLIAKTLKQGVCLKSVNTIGTNLTGIVAVVNYAYKKQVHIRYTLDSWRSFIDVQALYISGSIAQNIDTFSFSLFLPQCLPVGAKCEFCIRYQCDGKEYWDNNDRVNYLVECRALDPSRDEEDEGIFGIRRWL